MMEVGYHGKHPCYNIQQRYGCLQCNLFLNAVLASVSKGSLNIMVSPTILRFTQPSPITAEITAVTGRKHTHILIMAALWNRAGYYIFAL